jgi:hypothetical protein
MNAYPDVTDVTTAKKAAYCPWTCILRSVKDTVCPTYTQTGNIKQFTRANCKVVAGGNMLSQDKRERCTSLEQGGLVLVYCKLDSKQYLLVSDIL